MKYLLSCLLSMTFGFVWAQSQTKDTATADGEIRLSPRFMQELDRAFSFDPIEAPITPPDTTLSIAQLHEWVGRPDPSLMEDSVGNYRQKYDSTYFALKMYLKEFCKWEPPQEIKIPGLGLQGPLRVPQEGVGHSFTFDANALAKYVRPSQRKLHKSRKLAEENRAAMDACFPMGDK